MKKSTFGERMIADKSIPFGVNIAATEFDGVVEEDEDEMFWWLFGILLFMMLLLVVIDSLFVLIWLGCLDFVELKLSSFRGGDGDWVDFSIEKVFVWLNFWGCCWDIERGELLLLFTLLQLSPFLWRMETDDGFCVGLILERAAYLKLDLLLRPDLTRIFVYQLLLLLDFL